MATLKIKHAIVDGNDTGYCVIEEENFDKSTMEIYDEPAPKAEGVDGMSYDEVKVYLANNGVEFKTNISKKEAIALAKETEAKLAAK
jgi:hypothetical protein